MKKELLLVFLLLFTSVSSFAQETEPAEKPPVAPNTGLKIFNMYIESGFGDVLGWAGDLNGKNGGYNMGLTTPCLDMKASYLHFLPNIPWLGFSFTAQATYTTSPRNYNPGDFVPKSQAFTKLPSTFTFGAGIQLGALSIGVNLDGKLSFFYFNIFNLPKVQGLQSHNISIIAEQGIMLNGNGFTQGRLTQYVLTDGQFRLRYLMRFNLYVTLQLETILGWIPLLAVNGAVTDKADMLFMRFNPRLIAYMPGGNWSMFAEPRLFIYGLGKNGLPTQIFGGPATTARKAGRYALEFKIGLNYSYITQ